MHCSGLKYILVQPFTVVCFSSLLSKVLVLLKPGGASLLLDADSETSNRRKFFSVSIYRKGLTQFKDSCAKQSSQQVALSGILIQK